jgi:DNA (cytosine-5)-methyltransferase 1
MFSGIGGFELGIQRAYNNKQSAKIEQDRQGRNRDIDEQPIQLRTTEKPPLCVGYSEIDKYAIATYKKHFGGHKNYGNAKEINTEELPDFDFLVGGFPCQAFSIAGKRRGFEDTRGTLFFEIARVIKAKQPRMFLLENVKGLLNHDGGKTFTTILKTIDELGYDAEWQVLNSKHFVPQNRERIFIVGHLRDRSSRKVFPLGDFDEISDKKKLRKEELSRSRSHSSAIDANYYKGPDGKRTLVQVGNIDTKGHNSLWGRVYDPEGIAPNLNANGGGMGAKTELYSIDSKIRRLTPKECERLQGFPENWTIGSDTQRYKQCGNAVTVNVIEAIMNQIDKYINK